MTASAYAGIATPRCKANGRHISCRFTFGIDIDLSSDWPDANICDFIAARENRSASAHEALRQSRPQACSHVFSCRAVVHGDEGMAAKPMLAIRAGDCRADISDGDGNEVENNYRFDIYMFDDAIADIISFMTHAKGVMSISSRIFDIRSPKCIKATSEIMIYLLVADIAQRHQTRDRPSSGLQLIF